MAAPHDLIAGPALTQLLVANLLANALAHARSSQIRIEADAHRLSLCNASDAPPAALLAEGAAGRQPGLKGPASSGQGLVCRSCGGWPSAMA